MSLILDALNRSRQEGDSVPGLASEHFADEPSSLRPYVPWIGLLLAVLVIAGLLLRGGTSDEQAGNDQDTNGNNAVAAAVSVPTPPEAPASSRIAQPQTRGGAVRNNIGPEKQPAAVNASAATPHKDAAAVKAPVMQVPGNPPRMAPARAAVKPEPNKVADSAAVDRAALEALYKKSRQSANAQGKSPGQTAAMTQNAAKSAKAKPAKAAPKAPAKTPAEPADVDQILRLAQQEVANAKLSDHPAPFLVALSQQVKNDIPSVMYQRHDYSSTRGQSSVTLNGKSLRVGGAPTAGMRVDEILEESVVLTYRGTQFRLRALNSWVNL